MKNFRVAKDVVLTTGKTVAEVVGIAGDSFLQNMQKCVEVGKTEYYVYRLQNTTDAIFFHHAPKISDNAIWDDAVMMKGYFLTA